MKYIRNICFAILAVIYILSVTGCETYTEHEPVVIPKAQEPLEELLYEPGRRSASGISLPYQVRERVGKGTGIQSNWYKVIIKEPVTLDVSLYIEEKKQDLELKLLNQSGELVDSSLGIVSFEEITKKVKTGVYYIRVYAPNVNYGSTYLLKVRARPARGLSMDAPKYLYPGMTVEDTVNVRDGIKVRWYEIDVDEPSVLELILSVKDSSRGFDIKLHSPGGKVLAYETDGESTKRITRYLQQGRYFVEISPIASSNGGDYSLNLKSYPLPTDELTGPGSSKENAIEISPTGIGIIHKLGRKYGLKKRWYSVDIAKRVYMDIQCNVNDPRTPLSIELQTEEGQVLKTVSLDANKKIPMVVEKGTYYIRVFPRSGNHGETEYSIDIQLKDDPGAGFTKLKRDD